MDTIERECLTIEEFDSRANFRFGRTFMEDVEWQLDNIFSPRHNAKLIEETIKVFHREGNIFEICIIPNRSGGYFDDPQLAAQLICQHGLGAKGCYFIPNAIKRDAVGSLNTWHWSRGATKDADIERRRWLLIDADPTRPTDTSSTVAEKREAFRIIANIGQLLKSEGIEMSIRGDSGNGWHDNVPIDTPNDEESKLIVKDLLKGLDKRFSNRHAKVDTSVYNAARIWKLYGTVACKGESTSERPHRTSILSIPLGTISEEVRIKNWRIIKSLVERWRLEDKPLETPKSIAINELATPVIPEVASNDFDYYRAQRYAQEFPGSISGQGGCHNNTLTLACRLVQDFRQSRENAYTILYEQHNPKCIPCWSEKELWHKVDSALSKIEPDKLGCKLSSTSGEALGGASQLVPESIEENAEKACMKPFPIDVFPPSIGEYIENLSDVMGVDRIMAALPAVSIIAGVIGASRSVQVYEGYQQPACMWTTVIASSGSAKSPVLHALFEPINRLDKSLMEKNKQLRHEYEALKASWDNEGRKAGLAMPEKPKYHRIAVDDSTAEQLEAILEDSENGLLNAAHELDGFFTGLIRNSKVDLGAKYCKFYDGHTTRVDRIGRPPLLLDRPLVSITGMVQPSILAKHLTGERYEQGVGPRFIVACPSKRKSYLKTQKGKIIGTSAWDEMLEQLVQLRRTPCRNLELTADAHKEFESFYNDMEDRIYQSKGAAASIASKARNWALRWALIHSVATQCLEGSLMADGPIGLESMQKGVKFALWACEETTRCSGLLVEENSAKEGKELMRWVEARSTDFTARDLHRGMRSKYPQQTMAQMALDALVADGVLVSKLVARPQGGGSTTKYSLK